MDRPIQDLTLKDPRAQAGLIATVSASVFVFSLDYSMLNISLPIISKYFGASLDAVAWLPLAYLIIVTSTLLVFGKLGDTKGLKAIFMAGMAIFLAGTLLSSASPSLRFLLGSRVVQSFGEAMFNPLGIAILTTFLPAGARGKGIGIATLAQGLGFMLGSVAGGYINSHFIWRGIFLVNVPVAVITLAAAARSIPRASPSGRPAGFDIPGAALIFTALITFIYVLHNVGKPGSAAVLLSSLAVSAVAFVLFLAQERKAPSPLVDLALFRNADFALANLSAFLVISMLMGTVLVAPFFLELVSRLPVMTAGLLLMTAPLAMTAFSPVSGKLADRIGSRPLCVLGAAVEAASFLALSFVDKDSGPAFLVLCLASLGAGVGLFIPPNGRLVMAHGPQDRQGMVAGVYKIGISVGGIFGIAMMPLVITRWLGFAAASHGMTMAQAKGSADLMSQAFRAGFIFASAVCAAALVIAALAKDREGVVGSR
jgi:EmrB/QacA subfamily drug resistance transporter